MIEIRYKDIDPDTGEITRDEMICECPNELLGKWVFSALLQDLDFHDEPNREIYVDDSKKKKEDEEREFWIGKKIKGFLLSCTDEGWKEDLKYKESIIGEVIEYNKGRISVRFEDDSIFNYPAKEGKKYIYQ